MNIVDYLHVAQDQNLCVRTMFYNLLIFDNVTIKYYNKKQRHTQCAQ
jgi:hypothetical protein